VDNVIDIQSILREYNNWKWLLEFTEVINKLKSFSAFFVHYNEVDVITAGFSRLDEIDKNNLDIFKEILNKNDFILSTSAKGRFVRTLQDKEVAIECLVAFSNGIDKKTEGLIQALFYKKGLKTEVLSEKTKFNELLNSTRSDSKKFIAELQKTESALAEELHSSQQAVIELKAACRSLIAESERQKKAAIDIEEIKNNLNGTLKLELESKIGHATRSYDASVKDLHRQLDNEKDISKQRFEGFIDAYKNQMKLKAPVQYWTENVEHHKKSAEKFGIASIVLSLIIFLPIAYVAWEILAKEQVVWGKVGVVVFTTSLAIWLIRILVRMYLSHNHMQMNSQERVVMTQAYLALISEGGASSEEERNLVLQAIFRPVSTGIITDDASPHSIIELINKYRS